MRVRWKTDLNWLKSDLEIEFKLSVNLIYYLQRVYQQVSRKLYNLSTFPRDNYWKILQIINSENGPAPMSQIASQGLQNYFSQIVGRHLGIHLHCLG